MTWLEARENFELSRRQESFSSYFKFLYGKDVYQAVRRHQNLRETKGKLLSSLAFLTRCRDKEVTPKFVRLRYPVKNTTTAKILRRTSLALVRERIKHLRFELSVIDQELLESCLALSSRLSPMDWDRVDQSLFTQGMASLLQCTKRHTKKFEGLIKSTESVPPLETSRIIINLTDQQLDEATTSVLARGLNFAPVPKKIPVADIISSIEGAIHQLPQDSAEEIRREVARAVTKATIPEPNISQEENRALQMLGKNDNLVVLPVDKGNGTVLLSSTQYQEKINQLLNDPAYKILKKDPTSSVERRTNQLIKKSSLRAESKRLVSPSGSIPPRLYGLPKIHKPEVPLRPIVDAIGSPTYCLARYLTNLLQPLVGGCVHHVKNSTQFVQILDNIKVKNSTQFVQILDNMKVKPSDLLVSFDVVSLFTRVPLSEAMLLLSNQFPPDITELFRHTLTSTYFLQNNTYCEQIDRVAMGSLLSPAIANYYIEHLEHEILATAPLKPTHFFRYVDNTFVIWPHGQDTLPDFIRHINSLRPQIQFTMEVETNGKLPFLDILISRNNNGSLGHAVYRKPTHTNLYLNANSFHHQVQRMGILNTLAHRAVSISDPEQLDTEFQHLKLTLQQNGYLAKDITASLNRARHKKQQQHIMDSLEAEKPTTACLPFTGKLLGKISRLLHKHGIKTTHKPPPKIRNKVRSVKDDLGLRVPGIYHIPCECDAAYIGQTGRTIATRLSEHQRSIRLMQPEKSGLAQHCIEKSHRANFNNTEVLAKCLGYWDRKVKETLAIAAERGKLNWDSGLQLSAAWAPAIKFLTTRMTGRHQRRTHENSSAEPTVRPKVIQLESTNKTTRRLHSRRGSH
ncbi:uncharacterized protein [Periplaneta americana]|uniref:uncharacterized protein n=1 Tax=Periplaneta americana TaxID=6978 RepID=UPI0037E8A72D